MSETGHYHTDDAAFAALVAKQAAEYATLSDAKLAKKIRHLRGAEARCSLARNALLMAAFRSAATEILRQRVVGAPTAPEKT